MKWLPILCVSTTVLGQPILIVTEQDQNARTITLTQHDHIVDINSTITISIDKTVLQEELRRQDLLPQEQHDLLLRLAGVRAALNQREQSLSSLKDALRFYPSAKNPQALSDFAQRLSLAAAPLADLLANVPNQSPLMADLDRALTPPPGRAALTIDEQYAAAYDAAAREATRLSDELRAFTQEHGVYVQLGAFIGKAGEQRPIHLPGFDAYPTGEFVEVERWNLVLSEAQQRELAQYTAVARRVNQEGLRALIEWKSVAQQLLADLAKESSTAKCSNHLAQTVAELQPALGGQAAGIKNAIDTIATRLATYRMTLTGIRDKYVAGGTATRLTPDQFLLETNNDITSLITTTTTFASQLAADAKTLQETVTTATGAMKDRLTALTTELTSCATSAQTEAQTWSTTLRARVRELRAGRTFEERALELGDEVTRHTIDALPSTTTVDLRTTGARAEDDAITIKLAAGSNATDRREIATRTLRVFRVLSHIDLTVGLIFADPQQRTALQRQFQAAPAYSALFRTGSRRSMTWNRWWTPGFGINLASLDFNHDDSPELGIGVVGSALRDYIQAGYGYNLTESVPYLYFGLRLPVPYLTLPATEQRTP
jgi:hypothetical protein